MKNPKLEDHAPIIILPPTGMRVRGGGAEIGLALICGCGSLGTLNVVGAFGPGLQDFANSAKPGDTIDISGTVHTAVRGPFAEVGIHPDWDEGTSDREIACDGCQ